MPKLFSISIEVEEVAVGRVMRLLHNLEGVAKLDLDMGDTKPKPNGSGKPHAGVGVPKKVFGITGRDFLIKLLAKGKPQQASALRQAFEDDGRSPNSVHSIIFTYKGEGLVENTGDGYVLTKKMKDRLRHQAARKAAKHG
jgi:hypothetical protein